MASWYFVGLKEFTRKNKPIFDKLSIVAESLEEEQLDRKSANGPALVFIDGMVDIERIDEIVSRSSDLDHIYLVINTRNMSNQAEGELNRFLLKYKRIKGVIDGNQGYGFLISQFNGLKEIADLMFELETDQEYINDFEEQLDGITKHLASQLSRIKEVHKKVVPIRTLKANNLELSCKYSSGETGHSEFWDAVKTDSQIMFVLISTDESNQLTSVLSDIIEFVNLKHFNKEDLKALDERISKSLSDRYSLFTMLIDLTDLRSYIVNKGTQLIYINGREVIATNDGKISKLQLNPKDKFAVFSKGLILNYEEEFKIEDLEVYGKRRWELSIREFFNEVFFHSKLTNEGKFHKNDCISMVIEVTDD